LSLDDLTLISAYTVMNRNLSASVSYICTDLCVDNL